MSLSQNTAPLSFNSKPTPQPSNFKVETVTMPNGSKAAGFYLSPSDWIRINRKRKYRAALAAHETLVSDAHRYSPAGHLHRFRQVSMTVASTYLAWKFPLVSKDWLVDNASKIGVGCLLPGGELEHAIEVNVCVALRNVVSEFGKVAAK